MSTITKGVICMFWENFARLCNEAGKSPSRVALELGLSNGTASGWKKGAIPQERILRRLADYFGVPVESLTADDAPSVSLPAPSASDESQLLTYYRNFSREGKGRLLDFAESMERSGKYAVGANRFA